MHKVRQFGGIVFVLSLLLAATTPVCAQTPTQPNFLFIIVDDLNDYIEGYTDIPQIATPNIRSIIDSGTLFLNSYANAPGCAPSRTSFLSGKDLAYTQVYNNGDYPGKFRDVFTTETENQVVYALPEILKDSAGYFTYGINKVFHNPSNNDFDKSVGTPMCDKTLSWNRMEFLEDSDAMLEALSIYDFGDFFDWGMIPDSLESTLEDYLGAQLAINFIDSVAAGTANTCGAPFFLTIGFYKPHVQRYIPEKYFPEYYLEDIYAEPFVLPYNFPTGTYPYNGIVMPPQPDVIYNDYYQLPEDGISRSLADNGKVYDQIDEFVSELDPLPMINELLTDEDRKAILRQATAANYHITYIAAVQYIDAQIGRVLETLNSYPELQQNTIVVLIGDNGYALGEKRHWTKWALWETDLRVPMVIADPQRPGGQIVTKTVSLLDLYPTFCDMAGVNYPMRSDGTKYLDGHSMLPMLETPDIRYECPSIASYKQTGGVGSCSPQFSVRNERWHYIRYQKNNDGTLLSGECDSDYVGFETELYEIGIQRETDPYEWNNIAANSDYAPVMNFLDQWLPDSSMYLKKTFGTYINLGALDCYVDVEDGLFVHADLTDTNGISIALPDTLQLRWRNNKTEDAFYGNDITIDLSSFPDDVFTGDPKMMLYAELIGTDTTIIQGFDLAYVYVDATNQPNCSFAINPLDALTILVTDIEEVGTYHSAWWDFGDGQIDTSIVPPPHTYATPGSYLVSRVIQYGNDSCEAVFTQNITLDTNQSGSGITVFSFPNPADTYFQIFVSAVSTYSAVELYDLSGRKVEGVRFLSGSNPLFLTLDTSEMKPGMYIARISTDQGNYSTRVVVMH